MDKVLVWFDGKHCAVCGELYPIYKVEDNLKKKCKCGEKK